MIRLPGVPPDATTSLSRFARSVDRDSPTVETEGKQGGAHHHCAAATITVDVIDPVKVFVEVYETRTVSPAGMVNARDSQKKTEPEPTRVGVEHTQLTRSANLPGS